MSLPSRTILAALLLAAPAGAIAAERPARSALCPEDAPEGVRLPPRPGCPREGARPAPPRRDFGSDLDIRVGGRVSAGFGVQR